MDKVIDKFLCLFVCNKMPCSLAYNHFRQDRVPKLLEQSVNLFCHHGGEYKNHACFINILCLICDQIDKPLLREACIYSMSQKSFPSCKTVERKTCSFIHCKVSFHFWYPNDQDTMVRADCVWLPSSYI